MNKEELICRVAAKTTVKKTTVQGIVEAVFSAIADSLSRGEKFNMVGFGSFNIKKIAVRNGVNPRTKEKIRISARKIAHFTTGKKLSEKINR
ncbi:MAG: HU family DNA-binding protein [Firmicutes bacterium]|nr:HU family DNA-binding protein [Bacillota bacterium]